jgi:putative ABC transport system permease protein
MSDRLRRLAGVAGFGVHRTIARTTRSRQVAFAAVGVALAVALVVTVGGVALGLASGSAIAGGDVDYRIVPADSSVESVAVRVDGPKLGGVHATAAELDEDPRIEYVTPVDFQVLQVSNPAAGTREYVLFAGVTPERGASIAGLSLTALRPGDPHYANGSFDGEWTGEVVVSEPAGRLLNATPGTTLRVDAAPERSFTVVGREEATLASGLGSVPVAVVHLAELQAVTGGTGADQADQILVRTDDPSVRGDLERLYPRTEVVAAGDLSGEFSRSSLPLAVAVTALVTALTVGTLLVGTTMGLATVDDRRSVATFAAVGLSERSRVLLVLVEVLSVALLGGLLGTGLGVGGVVLANAAARRYVGVPVAAIDARLVLAGLAVAVLVGLFAAAYPLWLSRRIPVVEVLES